MVDVFSFSLFSGRLTFLITTVFPFLILLFHNYRFEHNQFAIICTYWLSWRTETQSINSISYDFWPTSKNSKSVFFLIENWTRLKIFLYFFTSEQETHIHRKTWLIFSFLLTAFIHFFATASNNVFLFLATKPYNYIRSSLQPVRLHKRQLSISFLWDCANGAVLVMCSFFFLYFSCSLQWSRRFYLSWFSCTMTKTLINFAISLAFQLKLLT